MRNERGIRDFMPVVSGLVGNRGVVFERSTIVGRIPANKKVYEDYLSVEQCERTRTEHHEHHARISQQPHHITTSTASAITSTYAQATSLGAGLEQLLQQGPWRQQQRLRNHCHHLVTLVRTRTSSRRPPCHTHRSGLAVIDTLNRCVSQYENVRGSVINYCHCPSRHRHEAGGALDLTALDSPLCGHALATKAGRRRAYAPLKTAFDQKNTYSPNKKATPCQWQAPTARLSRIYASLVMFYR